MGPDADSVPDLGGFRNNGSRVDALGQFLDTMTIEPLRQQGVHEIRFAAENGHEGNVTALQLFLPNRGCDDYGRSPATEKLLLKFGVGEEADLFRTGAG